MSKKEQEYEVCFVVYGHILSEDANIGNLDCNGTIFDSEENEWTIKDGRAYYTVTAKSPNNAYQKGYAMFETDNFQDLIIDNWTLEHVSKNDEYWYSEDITQ